MTTGRVLFVVMMSAAVAEAGAQEKAQTAQPQPQAVETKTESTPGASTTEQPQAQDEQLKVVARPEVETPGEPAADGKLISTQGGRALGMSILGNQEAPTSLVIVPWKSSEPGNSLGVAPLLDDSRQPVDKEVFMRALRYYEIRSETKR